MTVAPMTRFQKGDGRATQYRSLDHWCRRGYDSDLARRSLDEPDDFQEHR